MRQFTCQYEELDDPTREYLRTVRTAIGRWMPGIYFGRSNPWPIFALGCGPVVAFGFVVMGFASIKDAWATAMLQTAGVFLGGWMVLYAFRRFFAKSSPKFAGFYTYFDPHAAYQAKGEQVTVTDVTHVNAVTAVRGKGSAAVRFEDGAGFALVPGLSPPQAGLIEEYYAAMETVQNREGADRLSDAALGGAAREMALTGNLPRDFSQMTLEVEDVPAEPQKARSARPRLLWYLFLLACAGGTFAVFSAVNQPIRDEASFATAKTANTPTAYRGYLLDDRNTAHRAEAEKALATLYDAPIDRVRTNAVADPTLKEGVAQLLDSLRTPTPPVVSIRVSNAATNAPPLAEFEIKNLHEQIGDSLAQTLGTDHVRFLVFNPAPGENPHLDVVATVGPGRQVTCEVAIRLKPDGDPVAKKTLAADPVAVQGPGVPIGVPAPVSTDPVTRIRTAVLTALVGEVRNAPPIVAADAGN